MIEMKIGDRITVEVGKTNMDCKIKMDGRMVGAIQTFRIDLDVGKPQELACSLVSLPDFDQRDFATEMCRCGFSVRLLGLSDLS